MNEVVTKELMAKKYEALKQLRERYLKANKLQYAPDNAIEFDFINHLYHILGANSTDILNAKQNAAGVLNTPISDAEKKISLLLHQAQFKAIEIARLEAFDHLNDRDSLLNGIDRMMSQCMPVKKSREEALV